MKMFAILRKDLTQSFRSFFALFFMFAVPMLTTVLFYVIFGGFGGDDEAFDLPRTRTVIVNLDQGQVFSGDVCGADAHHGAVLRHLWRVRWR